MQMSLETAFLVASAVIGVAQLLDGTSLVRERGSLSRRSHVYFAFFEYGWAGLCAYLLSVFPVGWLFFLALSFVAYVAISFLAGVVWMSRAAPASGPPTHVPLLPVYFAVFFGCAYAMAALLLLAAA